MEFKALSNDEVAFYTFEQLQKIDAINYKLDHLNDKFASKLVERIVYAFITLVLFTFSGALIALVIL